MPRAALTDSEITAFRDRVCEAATALFARQGFDAVTMRGLAEELGCSPTTPYRYFGSKQEIFHLVRAAAFARFADALEAGVSGRTDRTERLYALLRAYVDFALRDPEAYRLMFELCQGAKDGHPELAFQMARSFDCCRREVDAAVQAGVLRGDVDTVAHLFWAGAHGITSLHLANQLFMGRSLDALIEPMARTLIRANAPPREKEGDHHEGNTTGDPGGAVLRPAGLSRPVDGTQR